ncbi:MAG TPA: hypothetical protein VK979_04345, partial [Guyparkeria sp.]|nr:hypothetical protein [Guyparkeria sp.]
MSDTTTIQQTSKQLKKHKVMGVFTMGIGLVLWVMLDSSFGGWVMLAGVAWWLIARIGVYWHHG